MGLIGVLGSLKGVERQALNFKCQVGALNLAHHPKPLWTDTALWVMGGTARQGPTDARFNFSYPFSTINLPIFHGSPNT